MKSILQRILVFALFVSTGLLAHAQTNAANTPIEYLRPMKNSFSIGVRMIGGANVTFSGDLGKSRYTAQEWHAANGYNDGTVLADSTAASSSTIVRPAQDSANSISWNHAMLGGAGVEGHFYTVLLDGNGDPYVKDGKYIITGDYLAYDASRTRNWSYSGTSQFRSSANDGVYDQVAMSAYSSLGTNGGTVKASDSRNPGIELTMGRVIQRFKRFEWGVTAGFAMSEFNAKTRQSVAVQLAYIRDIYNIYTTGSDYQGIPAKGELQDKNVTSFPTFNNTGTGAGGFTYDTMKPDETETTDTDESVANGTRETSSAIETTPDSTENSDNSGLFAEGHVNGFWQVKGVYYMLRVGPMARIPIGKRFSAYVSAGYMAAYIGSKFRYDEVVMFPESTTGVNTNKDASGTAQETIKTNQQYLGGYYADFNFEWWVSTRTGFYAGAAYERLGSYSQSFNGRKASVKMDNGLGWRFGIMTRF